MRIENPGVPKDWWASKILGARPLYEVFGRRPASLAGAVCTKMGFNPFPGALWLVVELKDAPDPLPMRWRRKGHDAVRLNLDLNDCHNIKGGGLLPIDNCLISLMSIGESIHVHLWADEFDFEATAENVSMLVQSFTRST